MEDIEEIKKKILQKAERIDSKDLLNDLKGFFEDLYFISDFSQNFQSLLKDSLNRFV